MWISSEKILKFQKEKKKRKEIRNKNLQNKKK